MENHDRDPSADRLDEAARTLMRSSDTESGASDAVFLAGFRNKLREYARPQPLTFGELCWKAVPAMALLSVLLGLVVGVTSGRSRPGEPEGDRVMSALAPASPADELDDELVLDAILAPGGRR